MAQTLKDETRRFLDSWMRVRQLVQAANFNQFHRAGLSATQFMTINAIPAEGATLSELAHRLNLSPATLSQTVTSLEDRGLVCRSRSLQDSRKINIRATAGGQEMQNSASGEFHRTMSALFARMQPQQRRALLSGLESLVAASQAPAAAPAAPNRRSRAATPAERNARQSRRA